MQVVESIFEMRKVRAQLKGSVGFVPTMGSLHEGHLALVRAARKANDSVVVSIYVNPAQFAPNEDFDSYPRDLDWDLELLNTENVDLVFTPTGDEIYPDGYSTWIKVKDLDRQLESMTRPHFFTGVATVVAKLFNIVQPNKAYFGRKDAQQLRIIQKLVEDLNLDLEIVAGDTVRESDGLAVSSRNAYMTENERKAAVVLWRTLTAASELWQAGEKDATLIREVMVKIIAQEPLAKCDYVSIADTETLLELETLDRPALVSLAVWIGKTRLIDNVTLA